MTTAGVDVGSASAKALILENQRIVDWSITPTIGDSATSAGNVMDPLFDKTGLSPDHMDYIVSTGYGRVNVPFAQKQVSEITCHARGAHWLFPEVRTILDIGGQDVKAIRCNAQGKVLKFVLNDKCAAGTGRYLDRTAATLGLNVSELGPLLLKSTKNPPLEISSICTVFATEEMMRWLRKGEDPKDILAGATQALVKRLRGFVDRVGLMPPLIVTGGVAKNTGVIAYLEKALDVTILSAPEPQIIGALGAALIAAQFG